MPTKEKPLPLFGPLLEIMPTRRWRSHRGVVAVAPDSCLAGLCVPVGGSR
jgi:hypothetical protein